MSADVLKRVAVLLCMLALLAATATAADAASFTASGYPASLTGESIQGEETEVGSSIENDWFELGATFYCKSHFSATLSAASSTLEAAATFTRCQSGIGTAEVNMTGCSFRYHLTAGLGDNYSGTMDLVCPTGASIDASIPVAGCAFTIPPQSSLATVHFFNNTSLGDISIQAEATKALAYTVTKNSIVCPAGGLGSKTGGTYRQTRAVTLDALGGQTTDIG